MFACFEAGRIYFQASTWLRTNCLVLKLCQGLVTTYA